MDGMRVYVPLQSKALVALDRATGRVAWQRELETAWPPLAGDGALYVATPDALHALDPASGATRWQVPIERRLLTAPIYTPGRLILALEQGDYVSLSAQDGAEQWRLRIPNDAPLFPPVAGGDGRLYVVLEGSHVAAISEADGRLAWRQTLSGVLGAPAWAPGRMLVGSANNAFYALGADDGTIEWKWQAGGDVIGSAADAADRIYFASLDNQLRAVNRGNGNQRWRKAITARPALPPQVVRDVVLLTGVAPVITSYSARTGEVVGTFTAPEAVMGAPLVDAALKPYQVAMVVITRDGRVVGLKPTAMLFKEPTLAPLPQLPGTRLARESAPARR